MGAFEAERGVFDIFASSGYARTSIEEKKAVKAGVASIYAAVKAGDKAALKTSYDAFTKTFVPVDTNVKFGCAIGGVVARRLVPRARAARTASVRSPLPPRTRVSTRAVCSPPCSALDQTKGQGYSTEYDWKARSSKGVIYQR